MRDQSARAYTAPGLANQAPVAPVGLAWEAALKGRPTLTLHMKDHRHPTPARHARRATCERKWSVVERDRARLDSRRCG